MDGNVHMDTVVPGRLFTVNVYLRVPEGDDCGGELVLYPVRKDFLSRVVCSHFFSTIDMQNFYPQHTFYSEKVLQEERLSPLRYKPAVGDVVLFDPAYPHAVRDFTAVDSRISLQSFIQCSRAWGARESLLQLAV